METRGSIRLHYGADPQLRAPDSGLRSTGRGAPEHRLRVRYRWTDIYRPLADFDRHFFPGQARP
jgi:hypothetical protein